MVWLPDGEKIWKISLFVLTQFTNVTDTASRCKNDVLNFKLQKFSNNPYQASFCDCSIFCQSGSDILYNPLINLSSTQNSINLLMLACLNIVKGC